MYDENSNHIMVMEQKKYINNVTKNLYLLAGMLSKWYGVSYKQDVWNISGNDLTTNSRWK